MQNPLSLGSLPQLWDVFLLFAIPIGGGIPAGVILAQKQGVGWLSMCIIYFCSDVLLALVFEPVMRGIAWASRYIEFLDRVRSTLKKSTERTIAAYGAKPGPILLIGIAFGVDPMTGRAAALARGHGFLSGWTIAIAGDMIFFFLIMTSTLWLNNLLGDGTWTAVIIMGLMMIIPPLILRLRRK